MTDFIIFLRSFWMSRRAWYRGEYLRSNHWRKFASWKKGQSGYECHDCHAVGAVDVHHLSYDILWFEWFFPWLTVCLCRKCHEKRHA